jgi:hypothetical protein
MRLGPASPGPGAVAVAVGAEVPAEEAAEAAAEAAADTTATNKGAGGDRVVVWEGVAQRPCGQLGVSFALLDLSRCARGQ